MTRPCRILYLEPSALVTGGAIALQRVITALDRQAFRPLVVLGSDGPLVADFRRIPGCRVLCCPLPAGVSSVTRFNMLTGLAANAAGVLRYVAILQRIADRWRPDVVHSNGLKMHGLSSLARWSGALVVWHMRDFIAAPYMPRRSAAFVRTLARLLPHVVVCNSETTKSSLVEQGGARALAGIRVVPDGIDCRRLPARRREPGTAGTPCVVMLGRIAEWKGQHVFVEAARHLHRTHEAVRFVIAGSATTPADAEYEERVRRTVAAYGLGARVAFAGAVRDVGQLLDQADILVHCSTSPEPFGQVIIEGMAAAVPVVATCAGAPVSIIEAGVNGRLVPPADHLALAGTLAELLDDENQRNRLAAAGLRTVRERYRIEKTVQLLADLYRAHPVRTAPLVQTRHSLPSS